MNDTHLAFPIILLVYFSLVRCFVYDLGQGNFVCVMPTFVSPPSVVNCLCVFIITIKLLGTDYDYYVKVVVLSLPLFLCAADFFYRRGIYTKKKLP